MITKRSRRQYYKSFDTFSGKLVEIKIYQGRCFTIVDILGKKINCIFIKDIMPKIKDLLDKQVYVEGVAYHKEEAVQPYKVKVTKIEEKISDPNNQVTLMDLFGMAPNATNGKTTTEFLRHIREFDDTYGDENNQNH